MTFRLTKDDLSVPDDTLDDILDRLTSAKIDAKEVTLLMDLGALHDIDAVGVGKLGMQSQNFIELSMTAANFGFLSVVASSMPKDVSQIPREGRAAIVRRELPLWLHVASSLSNVSIAFGDYGIVNPTFSLKVPATNANAKIRYSGSQEHHIFRGYCLREGAEYQQYHGLARQVVADQGYMGRDYSYGDGNYSGRYGVRWLSLRSQDQCFE